MARKEKYTKRDGTPLKRIPWKKGDSQQHCNNCELSTPSEFIYPRRCFEMNKEGKYIYDCYGRTAPKNKQKMYIFVKK